MPTSLRLTSPRWEEHPLALPDAPVARPQAGGPLRGSGPRPPRQWMGLALFRTKEPPASGSFERLRERGVEAEPLADPPGTSPGRWAVRLSHPAWGSAVVVRHTALQAPSPLAILSAPGLPPRERASLLDARSVLGVTSDGVRGDVYRDRKDLLRWLRLVLGSAGVGALDCASEHFWSPVALDEELSHDAALDVASLYVVHAVVLGDDCARKPGDPDAACPLCKALATPEGAAKLRASLEKDAVSGRFDPQRDAQHLAAHSPERLRWIHTHGLASLGAFDFDVLRPAKDALVAGPAFFRYLADDILEGEVARDSPRHRISLPDREVAMVPVAEFMRRASPEDRSLRDPDPAHASDRSVLCDPLDGGPDEAPRPSSVLAETSWGEILYPHLASSALRFAGRAVGTLPLFRGFCAEFARTGVLPLVQLAVPLPGDTPESAERLWFGVHELHGDSVDATLVSEPVHAGTLAQGDRGRHGLEGLTDWALETPCGDVTPYSTGPARMLRELLPELRGRR